MCPIGAICRGRNVTREDISAEENYWRLSDDNKTLNFYRFAKCPVSGSCLGLKRDSEETANGTQFESCNVEKGYQQLCVENYASGKVSRCRMCATCIDGYQHLFGSPACTPCPGGTKMSIQYVLVFFACCSFAVIFSLLVYCRVKSRGRKSVSSGVRKIIINFLQVSSLSVAWKVPWPSTIQFMLVVEGFSSSIGDSTISLTCAMPEASAFEVAWKSLLMWASLPLLLLLCFTIIYGLAATAICPHTCGSGSSRADDFFPSHAKVRNAKMNGDSLVCLCFPKTWKLAWTSRRGKLQSPQDNCIMACVYGLYLMYPTLTTASFSLLRCVPVPDGEDGKPTLPRCRSASRVLLRCAFALGRIFDSPLLRPLCCGSPSDGRHSFASQSKGFV